MKRFLSYFIILNFLFLLTFFQSENFASCQQLQIHLIVDPAAVIPPISDFSFYYNKKVPSPEFCKLIEEQLKLCAKFENQDNFTLDFYASELLCKTYKENTQNYDVLTALVLVDIIAIFVLIVTFSPK